MQPRKKKPASLEPNKEGKGKACNDDSVSFVNFMEIAEAPPCTRHGQLFWSYQLGEDSSPTAAQSLLDGWAATKTRNPFDALNILFLAARFGLVAPTWAADIVAETLAGAFDGEQSLDQIFGVKGKGADEAPLRKKALGARNRKLLEEVAILLDIARQLGKAMSVAEACLFVASKYFRERGTSNHDLHHFPSGPRKDVETFAETLARYYRELRPTVFSAPAD